MLFGGKVCRGVFERFSEEKFFLLRPEFVKALVSLREEIESRLFVGFAVRKRLLGDSGKPSHSEVGVGDGSQGVECVVYPLLRVVVGESPFPSHGKGAKGIVVCCVCL